MRAIKDYQCSGCVNGPALTCYNPSGDEYGFACSRHCAGTIMGGIGTILLGLPRGFCRLGAYSKQRVSLFLKFEDGWKYDKWNIAAWKYLTKEGHTLVRGISPRLNVPFLHIFLEDCRDKLNCLEITEKDIEFMD